ncbi:hypothetical protein [Sinomonas atrocyanea]
MNSGSPERSPLDDSFGLAGAWLAAHIEEDPAMLGLGDGMPAFERTVVHSRPDQFAVILFHPAEGIRHVVEVQLGSADADQMDRAVRHMEEERARLPLIPHRAAVAAERIPEDVLAAARQAGLPWTWSSCGSNHPASWPASAANSSTSTGPSPIPPTEHPSPRTDLCCA